MCMASVAGDCISEFKILLEGLTTVPDGLCLCSNSLMFIYIDMDKLAKLTSA